jgi:type III secretion protein R
VIAGALGQVTSLPLGALPVWPAAMGANPLSNLVLLGVLSLLPFLLMMTTSFLKFSVVLSILRNALGTQQIPPNPVLMGLAIVLTVYVMAPTGLEIYQALEPQLASSSGTETLSGRGAAEILGAIDKAKPPLAKFLARHAHPREVQLFHHWAQAMAPAERKDLISQEDLLVLIPAFAVSELTEAFAIGFLLFLPFLVVDMVVSNILLAMGMHMLSPVVVSLPFKLLLFIMIDGWGLLAQGLLQPYLPT